MAGTKTQWKDESVSDFAATAETDKSYNSKSSKNLPVWKKEEKKNDDVSRARSGSKVVEEYDIVVAEPENKKWEFAFILMAG
ncbi:hypothetical protein FAVG1_11577 [Fusarium avenaceum]|nr:hypothetical protein FAVG1_11577 [Fusarium avenaceum]